MLAVNDQGRDLVVSLGEGGIDRYFVRLQIALIFWSLANWYTSRVLLTLTDFSQFKKQGIEWWIHYTPRFFGIVPFIIVMSAIIKLRSVEEGSFWLFIGVLAAEMVIMVIIFSQRRKVAAKLNIKTYATPYEASGATWHSLMEVKSFKIFFYTVLTVHGLIVILFLLPMEWKIAQWFKPGTILLLGLTGLTTFLSALSYFNNWKTRPVFVLLVLLVAVCAVFNDNTRLRLKRNAKQNVPRPTIHDQFVGWVKYHTPSDSAKNKAVPLIIIATQGGGIRAMYWNNKVMTQLDTLYNGFTEHVFAISGVSGGGVGASFYLAYYRDFVLNGKRFSHKVDGFSSDDYLSSVTAGLLFNDNIQKFLPISWPALNRTRKLEDAWSLGYCDQTRLSTMDESFLSLWNLPDSQKYKLPSLFLNGTLAETGQKTILSNLDLDKHFFDVVDIEDTLGIDDVPLKTAASLCSRFPIITSGGLLCKDDMLPIGHVVDGGYAENTGIETALSIYESLREQILQHNLTKPSYQIVPIIIFIKNSKETNERKVIKWFIDIRTMLSAFVNAWDRRAPVGNYLASDLINEVGKDSVYFSIELDRSTKKNSVDLPLGWFLSEKAKNDIALKSSNIPIANKVLCGRLENLLNK